MSTKNLEGNYRFSLLKLKKCYFTAHPSDKISKTHSWPDWIVCKSIKKFEDLPSTILFSIIESTCCMFGGGSCWKKIFIAFKFIKHWNKSLLKKEIFRDAFCEGLYLLLHVLDMFLSDTSHLQCIECCCQVFAQKVQNKK